MKIRQLILMMALIFAASTLYADSLSEGTMDMAKDTATEKAGDAKDEAVEAAEEKTEDAKKGIMEKAKDKAMDMGGKLMGK